MYYQQEDQEHRGMNPRTQHSGQQHNMKPTDGNPNSRTKGTRTKSDAGTSSETDEATTTSEAAATATAESTNITSTKFSFNFPVSRYTWRTSAPHTLSHHFTAAQNNIGLHAPHMLSPQQQLAHQAQNYQQTHGVPHYPQTAQQITPQYNAHNPQRQPEATPSMPHHQQQLQQLHQMEQRQQPIQPNLAFHNTAVYQQLNQQQRHYQTQQQQQQQQQQQLQQLQLQFQQQQQRLQLQHQLLQQQVTPGGQNSAPLPPRPQQPHITSPSFNPTRNSPHLQAQASPLVSPTTVMSPRQQSSTRQRHAAPALLL
ncbi:hypothetical protein BZA77DRAFT_59015 [Pyronema omphalodes]|nr:hypothetical protein BZA77DRAFT_59015 [Pyronema omphalodes]